MGTLLGAGLAVGVGTASLLEISEPNHNVLTDRTKHITLPNVIRGDTGFARRILSTKGYDVYFGEDETSDLLIRNMKDERVLYRTNLHNLLSGKDSNQIRTYYKVAN